jgi:acyl dehydratase
MMPTRYFEDFTVDQEWSFDPWVLDEESVTTFAKQYDSQPMHTDPVAAADGPYGVVIASGWQTALNCVAPFLEAVMKDTAGLASPGFDVFQWSKPVRAGDPITPRAKVLEKRVSKSKPDRGLVRFRMWGVDADGDTVWKVEGPFFILLRPTG